MSMQYEFLENVCDILDSQRIPVTAVDRKAGPYPYYGANGVQDYVADYIFDDELVLLAEDGGNFGSKDKPIAYRVSGKCWVNNHAHVLKPKNCIDIDYFCYSIKFYDTSRLVNGATRQKLTQAAMRKMLIPMREIEIQRGIAVKIGRIEYLIQKRKDQLNRIDDLVKSQFIEMFGGGQYPECPVKEFVAGKVESVRRRYKPKDQIRYVDISSIDNKLNQMTGFTEYTLKDAPSRAQQCIERGDILVSTVRPNLRNIAMNTFDDDRMVASSGFCVLRATSCERNYLFVALLLDNFSRKMSELTTGANYPAIKDSDILEYRIPKPPIDRQIAFARFVEQSDKSKVLMEKSQKIVQMLIKLIFQLTKIDIEYCNDRKIYSDML